MKKIFILLIAFLSFVSCSNPQAEYKPLILISMDAYRYDYTDLYHPKNIQEFANSGVKAKAMIPSYPSKTFPNHWAIITGMYPGHNGLIHNKFYSPQFDAMFALGIKSEKNNPRWYGGKPFWQLVQENGMKSACYYWPGSEVAHDGVLPTYYYPYDESVSFETRVNQVVKWVKMPEEDRPDFITLYFHEPDKTSHEFGPETHQTKEVIQYLDAQIGNLLDSLNSNNINANIIILSDHGMQQIEGKIDYKQLSDFKGFNVVNGGGTQLLLYPYDKVDVDSMATVLEGLSDGKYRVIKKSQVPENWHYTHDRVPALWLEANSPYLFTGKKGYSNGAHGFDPQNKNMHAIFYAKGPAFKSNYTIDEFENVNVYPLMAKLMGIDVSSDIDGRIEVLEGVLLD